jgi:predicted PurR-regulated permease PerM
MADGTTGARPPWGILANKPLQALLALGLALLAWRLAGVLLLGFAALLVAITLLAIGDGLKRIAPPLPRRLAVAIAGVLVIGGLAGIIAFYGWRIADQYEVIFAKAAAGWRAALAYVQAHEWSRSLMQKTDGVRLSDAADWAAPAVKSAVGAVGAVLAYGVIILVCGVFLAWEPQRYRDECLSLVPERRRAAVADYFDRTSSILRRWLVSRLIVMVAIGAMSSVGLLLLGIPAAITLGLTGAVLTFIPYLGPILAAAPAVLVAFTASPLLALLTGLMFWAVHFIEGTFITPLVQDHEVSLSPVLTILGTLALAVLLGAPGVVLASPLILALRSMRPDGIAAGSMPNTAQPLP